MKSALIAAAAASVVSFATPCRAQCDSFVLSTTPFPAGTQPGAAACGDLDGDLLADLAVTDAADETVSLLMGIGKGGFGPAVALLAGRVPVSVALGDLDLDGDLDVVVADKGVLGPLGWQDHGFTVLWSSPGGFTSSSFFALPSSAFLPSDIALGDLDLDGDLDVVECLRGAYLQSKVATFVNDGAGGFAAPVFASTGYDPVSIELGDLDQDGHLDAVTANDAGTSFSRLHGNGDGTFGTGYSYSTGPDVRDVALGDMDGDGDPDLAVAHRYGVHVVRNDAGAFTWLSTLPAGLLPVAVELVELDGDGDLDLVAADQFGDVLFVWRATAPFTFALKEQHPVGDGPFGIAAGDLDGDTDADDLAVPLISAGAVAVVLDRCPPSAYCTAKVNSLGCIPAIGWTGTPSLSGADDFHVVATNELNHRLGIAFFGLAPASAPFAGGTKCVHAPLVRTPRQDSGGNMGGNDCSGVYDFHVSHAWLAQHGWGAGVELFGQYWSRDPMHPDGTGIALSDALRFTLEP